MENIIIKTKFSSLRPSSRADVQNLRTSCCDLGTHKTDYYHIPISIFLTFICPCTPEDFHRFCMECHNNKQEYLHLSVNILQMGPETL